MLHVAGANGRPVQADEPSVVTIDISDFEDPRILAIVNAWQRCKGWRAMPSDLDTILHALARNAGHISVADVVDDGEDFRFRMIGHEHVKAYGVNHEGKYVSDVMALSPRFGKQLKASYNLVRMTGRPFGFRGSIGGEGPGAHAIWFETAYLPVGRSSDVTHIVNAAIYSARPARFAA